MPIYSKTGDLPKGLSQKEKRNTVITESGVERIFTYTDSGGNARTKRKRYNKMSGLLDTAGPARPSSVEFDAKTGKVGTPVGVLVSFNQQISTSGSPTLVVDVDPTASGANNSTVTATAGTTLTNARNTLRFVFTPTVAGTYTVDGQTLGAATILSKNSAGADVNANTAFADAVVYGNLVVTA